MLDQFILRIVDHIWVWYNKDDPDDPNYLWLTEKEASKFPGMKGDDPKEFMKDVDKNGDDRCSRKEFDKMYYNIYLNNPPTAWW